MEHSDHGSSPPLMGNYSSEECPPEPIANHTTPLRFTNSPIQPTLPQPKGQRKSEFRANLAAEYRPLKLVKRGFVDNTEPVLSCGIRFEASPTWIWALRLSDWEAIYITDTDELRLRQYHQSTWLHSKDKLRIVRENRNEIQADTAGVWFLSGSRGYLDQIQIPDGVPRVLWAEGCGRRRPPDTDGLRWFSVSHEMVGGSTTLRGAFGQANLDNLEIKVDPLQRSIAHILKFSIRPIPCSLPYPKAHYSLGQRLSACLLDQPVVYETCFSRSGWGVRRLTDSELAQAFDLPPYILWESAFASSIVPIQVFRVVVDATLGVLRPRERHRKHPRVASGVQITEPLPVDAEWIADLGLWLPGSWASTAIAHKAVKSDNAAVEQYPWNQRVLLVFPSATTRTIRCFEHFGLQTWFRKLSSSLFGYLSDQYGSQWRNIVQRYARSLRERGKVTVPQLGKRKRGAFSEVTSPHMEGGLRENEKEIRGKRGRRRGKYAHEKRNEQLLHDVQCGLRVLRQVSTSSWWEWTGGSSLFFWRWNGREQIQAARDGIKIFVASALPNQKRQKAVRLAPNQQALVVAKLDLMVKRDYLETGHVTNTVHFFAVPKGDSDIRVVFDGTSSGLNETLWAPNFFLPSARSASMCMSFDTWMADMDFGDMFHNFPMDPKIRPSSGIELGVLAPLLPSLAPFSKGTGLSSCNRPTKLRWTRLFMGMRSSPYLAIRHYYWGEEFARGNPARFDNPMGYNRIVLNLPGMSNYDPALPKVMKWRDSHIKGELGHVAGDVVTFVDDVRITGYSKANCWKVYHQFASRVQYLGMQNAPRKFRPPSQQNAGAWTGTIFKIGSSHITKSVSQEKWDKGRDMIGRRLEELRTSKDNRPFLDRRVLERETGFLNHLSMTFETMIPYLKGFYLTLNSWREGRDENDWKVSAKRWRMLLRARMVNVGASNDELEREMDNHNAGAPLLVRASPGLIHDITALGYMMESRTVPEVSIRSRTVVTVVYGFGDASGSGLGATFTCGSGFNFRIGVWGADEGPESSNWKEFTNIVESLEDEARSGNLEASEVYMFTDNSTVESCASRGSSSSPKLLDLVIRLQGLMTKNDVRIHIFHVAGTRMIAQGTDGVSRGYLGQGVMAGETMVAHIPIHISAVERAPNLVPWIWSWCGEDATLLDENGWFESGHGIDGWEMGKDGFERPKLAEGRRTYVWAPPPIAADVAMAELRKARIKRQNSCHIFVCPRLCTTQWAKQLYRASDFVFELPVGFSCWPSCMHEPLLIGILFPFLSVQPWQIKGTAKMFAVGRELRKVLEGSEMGTRDFLRKFWSLGCDLQSMPEHMVRQLLFL